MDFVETVDNFVYILKTKGYPRILMWTKNVDKVDNFFEAGAGSD